ncbi:MAG: response regulator [Dongiaceae bacterium]
MSKRLLSIDDDPGILSLIRGVAREMELDVDVVTHGSYFMAADVRKKPDAITLDIIMPDMDGIELLRWLGDVGCTAHVILLSGASFQYAKMAKRLGEDGGRLNVSCLYKPFSIHDLRTTLAA